MPEDEFIFSLELSDEAFCEGMVSEVARSVLKTLGYADDPEGLTSAVAQVVAAAGRHSRCEIRFQTRDGKLRIAISASGHPGWQAAVALPHS